MKWLLILGAAFITLGCDNEERVYWYLGNISTDTGECRATAGTSEVLEVYRFRGTPLIPFAYGGSRLLVALPSGSLETDTTVSLPSEGASAVACSLGHASEHSRRELFGKVEVLERRGSDARVRLALGDPEGKLKFSGIELFVRQGRPES